MFYNALQIKGLSTELECEKRFIELGFIVSVPYGNSARYDFIVDTGKRFFRMQAKSSKLTKNNSYSIAVQNTASNMKGTRNKKYTKEDCDYICSIIEDNLILIPIETLEELKNNISIKISYPDNGNRANIHLIKDFTFEKILLPILAEDEIPTSYSPHNTMVKINNCPNCGKEKSIGAKLCKECQNKLYKQEIGSIEIFKNYLRQESSIKKVGQIYNFSPTKIQKICKSLNLPYLKSEINSYSDEEWAKL